MIKTSFQLFLLIKMRFLWENACFYKGNVDRISFAVQAPPVCKPCLFLIKIWISHLWWKCANTSWFTSYFETHYGRTPWVILIEKWCNFQDFSWNLWIFFWIWPRICFRYCASRGRTCTGAFFWSVLKKAFWNRNPDLREKKKPLMQKKHTHDKQWDEKRFFHVRER